MSGHLSVNELARGDKPVPSSMELVTEVAPESQYKCNPREILIQILYRPQEPIHKMLLDSTYTWIDQGSGVQRIEDPFGGWIHVTRNWQTRLFLDRTEFNYLLMLDADEGVPWYAPYALASHNEPLMSGVVCGFTKDKGLFACIAIKNKKGRAKFPTLINTKSIPAKGVLPVHNAGTGCLMVRRDVLEKLWAEYEKNNDFGQPFELPQDEQRLASLNGIIRRGEDICFTDRARSLGFEPKVDFSVRCIHQKIFHLAWPDERIVSIDPEDWRLGAFDLEN